MSGHGSHLRDADEDDSEDERMSVSTDDMELSRLDAHAERQELLVEKVLILSIALF